MKQQEDTAPSFLIMNFLRQKFCFHVIYMLQLRYRMEYTLKVYETPSGAQPLMDWLRELRDQKARTAIRMRLDRMQLGNFGYCEPVGEGVSEMKVDLGPGYRVYFGMIGRTIVLLLCGGDKKSQDKDIRRALDFFRDHKQREKADG